MFYAAKRERTHVFAFVLLFILLSSPVLLRLGFIIGLVRDLLFKFRDQTLGYRLCLFDGYSTVVQT